MVSASLQSVLLDTCTAPLTYSSLAVRALGKKLQIFNFEIAYLVKSDSVFNIIN
jgi:hypothetical protein